MNYSYQFPFAKYPAVRLVLLLIAGILLNKYLHCDPWIWATAFLSVVVCYRYLEHIYSASLNTGIYRGIISSYLLAVVLFGACWHSIHNRQAQSSPRIPSSFVWESMDFHGELKQINRSRSGTYQLTLRIDSTIFFDTLTWRHTYKARVVLDPESTSLPEAIELGSYLSFRGTVYPLEGKRNPHEFDYGQYLATQGIYTHIGADSIYNVRLQNDWRNWTTLRQDVLNLIEQNFDEETASLAKALLIGYKNELSPEMKRAFSRAGLSHIMAVSGLHVGFVVAPFWLLIPFLWALRWGRQIGLTLLILLLFFYAGVTGFTASVSRASITIGFITYGRLFHKARDSKNLTALAALIILLINPNDLFDIGFQLSFGAVYIILLTMPVITSWLPSWILYRWYGLPVSAILVSFVVQVGLFPLLSYYFGEFSLAAPLVNALVVPPLMIVVPFAIALLPVSAFFPVLSHGLNSPNSWFLNWINRVAETSSSFEESWLDIQIQDPLIFFIWISALFFLATLNIPRVRWKFLCILLAMVCLHQGRNIYQKLKRPSLDVTVFDVGQGDATLIKTPLGKHFLIDTGRWAPGYNSAKHVILPHLQSIGVKNLDAVFLSHPHADHIGGIAELIQTIPIDTIYDSGYQYDSELYKTYISLASEYNIPVVALSAGNKVNLDPSMRIFIYGPEQIVHGDDPNEQSLVLELIYGTTEFLFTGDAGRKQEARLIRNFGSLTDTDFLKVGHHGSNTSSSSEFLNTITPELAVVSLAKNNRFRHPHPDAVQRLQQSRARLYFTSLRGSCLFSSDGDSIYPVNWK